MTGSFSAVPPERLRRMNSQPFRPEGRYVLYWMQQSQRIEGNHALAFAVETALFLKKPVLVAFILMGDYPEARSFHFFFMLQGLQSLSVKLRDRGMGFVLRIGTPESILPDLYNNAAAMICDVGYLRHQRSWREFAGSHAPCSVTAVEGDVVVPVAEAYHKRAYAAYVLRPQILKKTGCFLSPVPQITPPPITGKTPAGESLKDLEKLLRQAKIFPSSTPVVWRYGGGEDAAALCLDNFMQERAERYVMDRRIPHRYGVSFLSPFLHFGMISPAVVVRRILDSELDEEIKKAFLEQLVVRRELAVNFVHHTPDYDSYSSLPAWAQETLDLHRQDRRPFLYDMETLQSAATHDSYWNAAMEEMRRTGYMHNVMRMYWGKKILEWSASPEEAFERLLYLTNTGFLDGRDPSSYAGCGWIFGLHDRPWPKRPVFGSVRYMAASGLERKSHIREYVHHVNSLPGCNKVPC
ncbi:deoxyribodipyrimidine photo-lyase [Desulfobotulus sp. H1]|uniref:Deoxyribodipyrimidine photo-lyase n=1 Tax=Desulfobotulus pelophilus TaxID=2823377 RepID=A0ABT3N878_9BACT|nr:deoxyribodipyrimidine photo-lyase [Desulfobotulus pelophilus]MCW7753660.1 deoxyribodipyrimidine photo-lyase [Desulfobotulus pelophilus]